MIYSHMTYEIDALFICNLKQLGTNLESEQQNIKFIMARFDDDLGYECKAGRHCSVFWETLTHFRVEKIRSATEIPNPPYNTEIIYNAEEFDMNLLTEEERTEGRISDLRLMQIYNQINFENTMKRQSSDLDGMVKSNEELIELSIDNPGNFYTAIAMNMTPKEKQLIISILENKSCENCVNGSCRVEHSEKIGVGENGKPQGYNCIGWENPEYVGKGRILKVRKI